MTKTRLQQYTHHQDFETPSNVWTCTTAGPYSRAKILRLRPPPNSRRKNLHPQTQLPARRPRRHPILRWVKLRNSRHGSDARSTQLSQLLASGGVNIDKTIHVADAEPLDIVRRVKLPLSAETGREKTSY